MRNIKKIIVPRLMVSVGLAAVCGAATAHAQEAGISQPVSVSENAENRSADEEIVVTGSRIRRSAIDTAAPVVIVDQQSFTDRGFVSASQALNQITSNAQSLSQSVAPGSSSGNGQQFPNLFNLGSGRTLTLVNGRRMVASSVGIGDAQVDTNIIPVGLIERVDIVQAGGAAVYGSDAIAGVVNYVLKDDFEGLELDAQTGISSRGDYPTYSLRGTYGQNFGGGRGNVAFNVEWSKTPSLPASARYLSNLSRQEVPNPADTGPNDGIPSAREITGAQLYAFNRNGVIFTIPAPTPLAPCGGQICFARQGNTPLQFAPDGSVVPYNPGTFVSLSPFLPFATGGEGTRLSDLSGFRSQVERLTGNMIGHYDLTDNIKLSGELLYARTEGLESPQLPNGQFRTVLGTAAENSGVITFTRTNPFLTPAAIATLTAASPQFAAGGPLFLSKSFYDLVPDTRQRSVTETYRGVLALEGDFSVGSKDFYWSASASHAQVDGRTRNWQVINARFNNAISAVRNSSGQIVCAVNADNIAANDDPACAPINPFGDGNVSDEARRYISTTAGLNYRNRQTDFLATLGGSLLELPGGNLKFSAAYEHRIESAKFTPLQADQLGLYGAGTKIEPQSGKYHTNELSAELLIPIVGGDFTLPLVQELELNGAYRYVDNSIAGKENVWSISGRYVPVEGLTFRASRSRNFRAPTLTQLFAPSSTAPDSVQGDPCDVQFINSGPNPAARRAACLADFQANPGFGVLPDGSNAGASAEMRLALFRPPTQNLQRASITTGGNPNLQNEISNTLTYGLVIQPRFVPGLTITADRIEVDLKDGLAAFETSDFAQTCYDSPERPADLCSAFKRLAQTDGLNQGGTIVTGRSTTFNASVIKYRGEVYNVNYNFPLTNLFGGQNLGTLELAVEATHNSLRLSSVTGTSFTRLDGTIFLPEWNGRFDARYTNGPFRLTYQLNYLDKAKIGPTVTAETNPQIFIDANITHNLSVLYDFGRLELRAGINNFTDKSPSYYIASYGDIIGRQFFVGARVKL